MFSNIDMAISIATVLSLIAAAVLVVAAFLPDGLSIQPSVVAQSAAIPPQSPLRRMVDQRPWFPVRYRLPWTM